MCSIDDNSQERRRISLVKFLPTTITIFAFCFGLTSIRFALQNRWELAVLCIFLAALLDTLDGRIARLVGHASSFGAELDSLSDLVCFGVAPSLVLYLHSAHLLHGIGWGVCMFFPICCALRLARFNTMQQIDDTPTNHFVGVPAPAGAMIALLPMILWLETSNYAFVCPYLIAVFMICAGILMISTIKTFSSKMIKLDSRPVPILAFIACFIICLMISVWATLGFVIVLYMLSIPYSAYVFSKQNDDEAETSPATSIDFDEK